MLYLKTNAKPIFIYILCDDRKQKLEQKRMKTCSHMALCGIV